MKRHLGFVLIAASALGLLACGTPRDDSGDQFDEGSRITLSYRDGAFTGRVGPAWSDEELRANKFGVFCQGQTVENLVIERQSDGTAKVSGKCAG
jgi:hypothetical protein